MPHVLLSTSDAGVGTLDWLKTNGVRIALIVVLALAVSRIGAVAIRRTRSRLDAVSNSTGVINLRRTATVVGIMTSALRVLVWTVASLLVLGQVGVDLGPLIAGAAIVGVALGFGAQSLVRDFLTGFFVLLEDQYAIGDVVEIGQVTGTVERFTLRMTSLRSEDGTLHNIANGTIQRVSNSSAGWARALVDVGVALEADLRQVWEAFNAAGEALLADRDVGGMVLEAPDILGPQAMSESQVIIRVAIK